MNQITVKFLQAQVDRLNRIAGTPLAPYVNGKAQIGCYHLSGAYGGYALHQMSSDGGGVTDVLRCGHQPKRELSNRLSAFIAGIETVTA
jgi:hypothetical protein